MVRAGMAAGGKGVQPLYAVRKPLIDQELQRAIGHRGLVAKALGRQPLQHVIGAERAMIFQQDFQHAPPHRGQPCAVGRAVRLGLRQPFAAAVMMVMGAKRGIIGHGGFLTCYDITYIDPATAK